MTRVRPLIGLLLAASAAAAAAAEEEELTLERLAALERDEQAAVAQAEVAPGGRPPQELSTEERAEIIRRQQDASRAVFERHGVDPKAYVGRSARLTPEERAQVEAEKQRLDAAEAERRAREAAAQADPPAPAPEDVEVIRGITDANPVELYREEGGPVEVDNLTEMADPPEHEEPIVRPSAPERPPRPKHKRRR